MDKEVIIERVTKILKETPSAMEIVKKGGDRNKRFQYLARYMVERGIENDAMVYAQEGHGIAILFKTNSKDDNFWKELPKELGLVMNVTGVKNALQIVKNQKYIKNQRPKEDDYYYCWFWGIVKESRGADTQVGKEMKDEFLMRANRDNIPLYAETSTYVNVLVYTRFGFELFHTWERPNGKKMWFLRYVPKKVKDKQQA